MKKQKKRERRKKWKKQTHSKLTQTLGARQELTQKVKSLLLARNKASHYHMLTNVGKINLLPPTARSKKKIANWMKAKKKKMNKHNILRVIKTEKIRRT